MAVTSNTLNVVASGEHLPAAASSKRVVSLPLAQLQEFLVIAGDANAPHFKQGNEPLADNRAFQAVDGHFYYRPQLRVGQRSLPLPGPEVRFLKDAQGKVRLEFLLEESPTPGLPV